jgi:hypothetical protein
MEVGQGPNVGCSAKGKKSKGSHNVRISLFVPLKLAHISAHMVYGGYWTSVAGTPESLVQILLGTRMYISDFFVVLSCVGTGLGVTDRLSREFY